LRLLPVALWLPLAAMAGDMIELQYQDRDPDGTVYPTRILITKDHLRIDQGRGDGDFILHDRKAHVVYSVEPSTQRILRIDPLPVPDSKPQPWNVSEETDGSGSGPDRIRISVNNRLCSELQTVPDLYPAAVAAMREDRLVLAGIQWRTQERTPVELRDDCDLARYVLETGRELQYGLPIEESRQDGFYRRLLAHREIPEQAELFRLPALPILAISQ
jgi:hypothetical protein